MPTKPYPITRSVLADCRRAGMRHGIIRLVLTSWLFTLTVCAFGIDADAHAAEPSANVALPSLHHHDHEQPGADDICCAVLQHQVVTSAAGAAPTAVFKFLHNVMPPALMRRVTFPPTATTPYRCAHPPDCAGTPARIANFLWPNAPPRHLA